MSKGRHRQVHRHHVLAVLAVLAPIAVVVLVTTWLGSSDGDRSAPGDVAPATAGDGGAPTGSASADPSASPSGRGITLVIPEPTAAPLEAVRLTGEYAGAAAGTVLRVQVRYPRRGWVTFPLPTAVDDTGRFATYLELGRIGDNEVRVIEPESEVTSNTVHLRVR